MMKTLSHLFQSIACLWLAVGFASPLFGGGLLNSYRFTANGSDPSYSSVTLLLHCNGANSGTTFSDNSTAANTITAFGNAKTSTAQSKFSGSSLLLDGAGDYLSIPDSNNWHFTGDFTIELWFRPSSLPSSADILGQRTNSAFGCPVLFYQIGGQLYLGISFNNSSFTYITASSTISANNWYYLAATRSGSTFTFWINGVNSGTYTSSASFTNSSEAMRIGGVASSYAAGNINDVRITKGVARDVSTIPTAAFPDS